MDEATLRRIHMQGYVTAIEAGSPRSCRPTTLERRQVLGQPPPPDRDPQGRARLQGFLISDYNAIDDLPGDWTSHVKQSSTPDGHGHGSEQVPRVLHHPQGLVEAGEVPMSRIDDAFCASFG